MTANNPTSCRTHHRAVSRSSGAIPRRHHDRLVAPKFQHKNTGATFKMIALIRFGLVVMFIR